MEKSQVQILKEKAQAVLKENIFSDGKDSGYTAASGAMIPPGETQPRFLYPFQWLWDTFFIAGWSSDIDQSLIDVKKYLASQATGGFLGHIRYNREILSRKEYFPSPEIYYPEGIPDKGELFSKITQPPNVAYGIWELAQKISDETKRLDFLKACYPAALRYHRYIYENLSHNGLIVTIHPWAAGDDNSPKWDGIYEGIRKNLNPRSVVVNWLKEIDLPYERVDIKLIHPSQRPIDSDYDIFLYLIWLYNQYRWDEKKILAESPFRVVDPLPNSILIRSNECLLKIAEILGYKEDVAKIQNWNAQTKKGLETLYDPDSLLYYPRDLVSGSLIKVPNVSSLIPIFSLSISSEKAAQIALTIQEIHAKHPSLALVPSTFPDYPGYEPDRYWRGPSWIIINTLISDGLRQYGHQYLADRIDNDSLNLVFGSLEDRGGFFEYFNPETRKGLGSPLQSWTAASVLKICENFP